MSNVTVQQVNTTDKPTTPVLEDLAKRFDAVRRRAFELFEQRGWEHGHDVDDWFAAERELLGAPLPDFMDKGDHYELEVALPGFEAKDVQVTTTPEDVIVHAAATQTSKSEKDSVEWNESSSSELYRRIPAPSSVDTDKAVAKLDNGRLSIVLPKGAQKTKGKSSVAKAG